MKLLQIGSLENEEVTAGGCQRLRTKPELARELFCHGLSGIKLLNALGLGSVAQGCLGT